MSKKKILFNTILFLFIILFIKIFQLIFGNGNTLVGVTVITIALALLERDLSLSPIINLSKLIGINLLLVFCAFGASNNVYLGILINFLVLFMIGYLFNYNVNRPIVIPFGLQYLFMLFSPVYGDVLLKRILSLIFGAFFTMFLQLLINKNRLSKTANKTLDTIYKNISLKINLLKQGEVTRKVTLDIEESIGSLKKIIYSRRIKNYFITKEGKIITNLLWSLERLNFLLTNINEESKKDTYQEFLDDIYLKLQNIIINNSNLNSLKMKYINSDLNVKYINEIDIIMQSLFNNLSQLIKLNKKEKNHIENDIKIPNHFHKVAIHKRNFKLNSLRVSFGIRLAILGTLTAFITYYFNLSEGRWMTYTILSLTQSYSENSNIRVKQRLKGTLIGALIVLVCFYFIRNPIGRSAIVLLSGYLNPFATNYKNLIVLVTISAIGSVSLIDGYSKFIIIRILFVSIGAVMTLLANKYILPYTFKEGKKDLVTMYNKTIIQMLQDIEIKNEDHCVKNLFLLPALIEEKMELLNFGKNNAKEKQFMYNQKILINSIYSHYLSVTGNIDDKRGTSNIIKYIKSSISSTNINKKDVIIRS